MSKSDREVMAVCQPPNILYMFINLMSLQNRVEQKKQDVVDAFDSPEYRESLTAQAKQLGKSAEEYIESTRGEYSQMS